MENSSIKETVMDDYYFYPISKVLKTDFDSIQPHKGEKIFVCIYRINKNTNTKVVLHPFLQYLLYKYPDGDKTESNKMIFPFEVYKNGYVLDIANKMVENILGYKTDSIGYSNRNDGYFLFYQHKKEMKVKKKMKNDELWWCLIDEICNHKKIINFPVHKSVYTLFYQKSKLIHLKDKNKNDIEVPVVSYYGGDKSWLPMISSLGVKRDFTNSRFGPYFFFGSFTQQTRFAGWSGVYKINNDGTVNGKYNEKLNNPDSKRIQGGYVRFALFLGETPRYILYRKSDIYHWYIDYLDFDGTNKKTNEKAEKEWIKHWTNNYDSVVYNTIQYKNMPGYFNIDTHIAVKDFVQQVPLSYHLLNMDTLKTFWDPFYEGYDIL